MKILFRDRLLDDGHPSIPKELITPALSETYTIDSPLTIYLAAANPAGCIGVFADCIGIGNCDKNKLSITVTPASAAPYTQIINLGLEKSGLWMLGGAPGIISITINTYPVTLGRLGLGRAINIPTSIMKEPSFCSTAEPRTTLSGQVIPGRGGYNYKTLSLDSRYKINEAAVSEIMSGYKYIGMGYPFFIDLSDEAYKLPFSKLYATEANQQKLGFESGVRKFLYSRRFEFRERF